MVTIRQEWRPGGYHQQVGRDQLRDRLGWVDGQLGRIDDWYFKTRFTPRRPRSIWSQVNRERVERLETSGRMRPAGRAQAEQARTDGRWAAAYARQSEITADTEFVAALDANAAARTLFDDLDAANRFAILFRIQQSATREKRAAKIAAMVAMLEQGGTIYPRKAKRGGATGE